MTIPAYVNLVTDPTYGGLSPSNTAAQNRAIIQTAIDDLIAANYTYGTKLYIPMDLGGGVYHTDRPILCDLSNLSIVGDGPNQTLIQNTGGGDVFQFGFARGSVSAGHWVNANSVLDSSAQGLYAFRTFADTIPTFAANNWAYGPEISAGVNTYWAGVTQLTLDFFIAKNGGYPVNSSFGLFGLLRTVLSSYAPSPWFVQTGDSGGTTYCYLYWNTIFQRIGFVIPSGSSPARISIQLDLSAGTCLAFVNRVQVAVLGSIPTGALQANDYAPFNVGTVCLTSGTDAGVSGAIGDFTFYGLKVTVGTLYKNNGVGQAQARIDNATLNDQKQFFTVESTTVGLLPLNDSGNNYRLIPSSGIRSGWGWLSGPDHATNGPGANIVSGMAVYGYYYGSCLSFGAGYDNLVEKCTIGSTARGIGGLNLYAAYPLTINDCTITQTKECSVFAYRNFLWATNLNLQYYGRSAMRLLGCDTNFRNSLTTNSSTADNVYAFYDGGYGCQHSIEDVTIDFEGSAPSSTYFLMEAVSDPSATTTLRLKDVDWGTVTGGVGDIVLLGPASAGGAFPFQQLILDNVAAAFRSALNIVNPGSWSVVNMAAPVLAANGLDNIVIESGLNARQALAIIAAACAGQLSGAVGPTVTIAGAGVATQRLQATVDASGNRTAVTLSPPT